MGYIIYLSYGRIDLYFKRGDIELNNILTTDINKATLYTNKTILDSDISYLNKNCKLMRQLGKKYSYKYLER